MEPTIGVSSSTSVVRSLFLDLTPSTSVVRSLFLDSTPSTSVVRSLFSDLTPSTSSCVCWCKCSEVVVVRPITSLVPLLLGLVPLLLGLVPLGRRCLCHPLRPRFVGV